MKNLTIIGGYDKTGNKENIETLTLSIGELYTIVGNTGSGKSRLIKDIEQLATGESITKRKIIIDDDTPHEALMAHLGQNMRFVLDVTVEEFFILHGKCKGKDVDCQRLLEITNDITPEKVNLYDNLNELSGGQTRAVMIADISLICNSPVVLIDEIENAGIDKEKALLYLTGNNKLVIAVTHDAHTALMANKRIIMNGGAISAVVERTEREKELYRELSQEYKKQKELQAKMKQGLYLA